MSTKAANRYARAFLETANELDLLESVREDMLLISNTFSSSPDLGLFLRSPIVRGEKKRAALIEIFRDQIQEITSHLLSVLTRKSRERLLEEIATQFLKLYNQQKGIVDVHVVSARELSEQQKKQLIHELQASMGRNVLLETEVDPDLIGGLKVIIDDTVTDGTVKHKLNQLRDRFTLAGI